MSPPAFRYATGRRVCRPLLRAVYRLEVRGAARVPAAGPLVVVANHESVLDPFVLGCALERELRFMAKAELWRYRHVAWAMDRLRAIRVERGRGDREALDEARRALAAGEAVAVFPQGAVRGGEVWLRGAARLALVTGAPVIPVRLVGTARALSRGHVGLPKLVVLVGEPIAVERAAATVAAARELTERLRRAVETLSD